MGGVSVSHPPTRHPFRCCLLEPASHHLDSWGSGCRRCYPLSIPNAQRNRSCLPPTWTKEELGKRSGIERFFGRVFLFFHLQRPPLSGWSTITRQVAASLHSHRHRCFSCATGRPSRSHPLSKARFSSCVGGLMSEEIPSTDVLSSQHNLFFLSPFPFSSDPATHAPRELRAAPSNA